MKTSQYNYQTITCETSSALSFFVFFCLFFVFFFLFKKLQNIPLFHLDGGGRSLAVAIGLVSLGIELEEEHQEGANDTAAPNVTNNGARAGSSENPGIVHPDVVAHLVGNKLDNLQLGEVSLPPERIAGRLDHVKVVHEDMHQGVCDNANPLRRKLVVHRDPAEQQGDNVVVVVEEDQGFLQITEKIRAQRSDVCTTWFSVLVPWTIGTTRNNAYDQSPCE